MATDLFLARMFRDKDYPMIEEWYHGHDKPPVPFAMLPKLGIVVYREKTKEDVAALWLYMDNSIGVCFVESVVTKPKLSLKDAKLAIHRGLDFLKKEALELGYGIMLLRTYPSIAKCVKKMGFIEDERGPLVGMTCLLKT